MTRRTVLERLAAMTDAVQRETASIDALVAELDADRNSVESHLVGLAECELARIDPDDTARVTITGEELLALDPEGVLVVDSVTAVTEYERAEIYDGPE
ncbi:MAG: hypothetical protein ABEI27_03765 [Halobellus sp.]|uniref:hypothetical protein n=1 Tax=Halobellus sp. TaxID=1979212 RepID=UPI0035D456DE